MTKVQLPPAVSSVVASRRARLAHFGLLRQDSNGVDTANSRHARATATANASAHTKGTYAQVVASTATESQWLAIRLTANTNVASTDTSMLLDVATGAAASEVVVVPDLLMGYKGVTATAGVSVSLYWYVIPVRIKAGVRVSIRCQSIVGGSTCGVEMAFGTFGLGRLSPPALVSMGVDTSTSKGIALAATSAANTKSTWVDITTSSPGAYDALVVGAQGGGDTQLLSVGGLLDIGIWDTTAGAYLVLDGGSDIGYDIGTNEVIQFYGPTIIPGTFPIGSRFGARHADASVAGSNLMDVALYGVPVV